MSKYPKQNIVFLRNLEDYEAKIFEIYISENHKNNASLENINNNYAGSPSFLQNS